MPETSTLYGVIAGAVIAHCIDQSRAKMQDEAKRPFLLTGLTVLAVVALIIWIMSND